MRAFCEIKRPCLGQMCHFIRHNQSIRRSARHAMAQGRARAEPKEIPAHFTVTTPLYYVNAGAFYQ